MSASTRSSRVFMVLLVVVVVLAGLWLATHGSMVSNESGHCQSYVDDDTGRVHC